MKSPTLRFICLLCLLAISFILYSGDFAYADHSKGNPCYGCHILRTSQIIENSRSIRIDKDRLGYDYSGNPQPRAGHPEIPSTDYIPGGPFDCSFCHLLGDIGQMFADKLIRPYSESSHPVDVIDDEEDMGPSIPVSMGSYRSGVFKPGDYLQVEIACADCHMRYVGSYSDVVPATLQSKDNLDGYPNHRNIIAGYEPYKAFGPSDPTDYPNDAINKAHLTAPYGYSQSQGGNTINPTHSDEREINWGGTLDETTLLCFLCHQNSTYTNPPTMTHNVAENSYDIENEYNSPATQGTYAGHVMRINGGGTSNIFIGDKMPCFNCHETHASMESGFNNLKLLRRINTPPLGAVLYGTSKFTITGLKDDNNNGRIDDERPICAACHDTGLAASSPVTDPNALVGITAVDPYDSSAIHACAGVKANLTDPASAGCLEISDLPTAGCHRNTHNPDPAPCSDCANCYSCHGSGCASVPQVNDGDEDNFGTGVPSGRGGDFGGSLNTKLANGDPNFKSSHNIDFSASNPGGDNCANDTRGSCTVCHTVDYRPNGVCYHADGDPRNDFRDVDDDSVADANELQSLASGKEKPVWNATTSDYRYDPEWFLCVDCHDDELMAGGNEPYFDIIGDGTLTPSGMAPLNLDQLRDVLVPFDYVYGTGDYNELNYDVQTPVDNATPVWGYNWQPFKAHYYQTDGTADGQVWSSDVTATLTDPTLSNYDTTVRDNRIIDCLSCHYGHGSRNASLYKSPDPLFSTDHPNGIDNANGRDICLDCHDDRTLNEINFPKPYQVTSATAGSLFIPPESPQINRKMFKPPINDRYGNPIVGISSTGELGNPHETNPVNDPIGVTISCMGTEGGPAPGPSNVYLRCHNPHSPSCETCHAYPPDVTGLDQ